MQCTCVRVLAAFLLLFAFGFGTATAEEPALSGTVQDSTGGALVGATVAAMPDAEGEPATAVTDGEGEYQFAALPAGEYELVVEYPGFAPARQTVTVAANRTARANFSLEIALHEQVDVVETINLSDSPLTRTLTSKELALLPTDSRQLLQRLREMAGSRGELGDVAIYVDGFREGLRLPPKESIGMVRISAHPFSAEYQEPGHARIEITTRPGSERVTVDATATFSSDDLNARDYFAPAELPGETWHLTAYLASPLVRKRLGMSLFGGRWTEDVHDVFNATVLDDAGSPVSAAGTIHTPTRIDSLLAGVNTLAGVRHTVRALAGYTKRTALRQGVDTIFDLPEHVYDSSRTDISGRASLLSIFGPSLLHELHVEYTNRDYRHAAAIEASETLVLDSFYAGGDQDFFSMDEQTHTAQVRNTLTLGYRQLTLKGGGQAEYASSRIADRTGFGGSFLFGSGVERDAAGAPVLDAHGEVISIPPLEQYRRSQLGLPGYGASQYAVVTGDPDLSYAQWWLSWFGQGDWRITPRLLASFGVRQEWQTYVSGRGEIAARAGVGWTIDAAGRNTIRAGVGRFYARLGPELTLDTTRYDGAHHREVIVNQPANYPLPPALDDSAPPALHTSSPEMRVPATLVATASYERQLTSELTAVLEYAYDRGERLLLHRNVNAPGADGMRPMPAWGPILEYGSLGESRRHQVIASTRYTAGGLFTVMGGYRWTRSRATTDGFRTAPANMEDLRAEWGMPTADREHRAHLGATFYLPWGVFVSPYAIATSGRPFNITTGRDANGDTLFTERPGFANPGDPGAIETPFGLFTANPAPGAPIVPRNYGRGSAEVRMDFHVSKVTRVRSRARLTLACDVTNLLNRGLFTGYYTVVTAPQFGEPSRALPMRRVLLSARISY